MALVRWDPIRDLTALQGEVNRLFSRMGSADIGDRQAWTPSIDVIETDEAVKLKAELAGMDAKDISIEVQDNVLTISGERHFEEEVKEDKYYRIERRYGSFSRSIAMPQAIDEEKIQASYENGVLEVSVPKAEIPRPRKIQVTAAAPGARTVEAQGTEAGPEGGGMGAEQG